MIKRTARCTNKDERYDSQGLRRSATFQMESEEFHNLAGGGNVSVPVPIHALYITLNDLGEEEYNSLNPGDEVSIEIKKEKR